MNARKLFLLLAMDQNLMNGISKIKFEDLDWLESNHYCNFNIAANRFLLTNKGEIVISDAIKAADKYKG